MNRPTSRQAPATVARRRYGWLVCTAMAWPVVLGVTALTPLSGAQAQSLPAGGTVTHGSAAIDTGPSAVTITQGSKRAVIDWNSFSVAQGNSVTFRQPDADSATLNRVTGDTTSTIAGSIVANGSVYLVNPNGIAITATGNVQTGGGFVASTLDMSDADFMAGEAKFAGTGASASVQNAGSITAGTGAYVAMLGGMVANSGTIAVPMGRLALGSGEQVALDLNGGNFLQVAVPTSALVGDAALIDNSGTLSASGGLIELKAAVLRDSIRNVVNMSGAINADSAVGDGGRIILLGGADPQSLGGKVKVTGTLSARATGATGNGGFVETSGAKIDLNEARVTTLAANGSAGTWLIDPADFTVAASGGDITGAALSANLANGNVAIFSNQGTGGVAGDINVNDAVSWSANTLTLDAYRDINVNAVMNASGTAGFVGIVGDVSATGVGTAAGNFDFGVDIRGFYGKLNLGGASTFRLNGQDYVVIRSLGAEGSTTGTDLQGINVATSGAVRGFYVLGADIDASATAGWNGGQGFTPIGYTASGLVDFRGHFNGLGHTIAGLTINRTATNGPTGLFARPTTPAIADAQTVTFSNVGLVGGSVIGSSTYVGSLVGDGTRIALRNVFSTADVTGGGSAVGGLVGGMSGSIVNAFATGDVIGDSIGAGGLVGDFNGTIDAAFATGDVTGCNRVTACYGYGGLIGTIDGDATITNVFATGGVAGWRMIGGLVGQVNPGSRGTVTISDAYATGGTYGNDRSFASVGGLIGQGQNLTLNRVFASGSVTALAGTWSGSLVGENLGTVTIANGYWDTEGTGYDFSCGRILCSGASGLTTNESLLAASFAGWNVNGAGSAWRNYEGRTAPLLTALMTPAYVRMRAPSVTTTYNGADQTGAAGIIVQLASNGNLADSNWIYGTATVSCSAGAGNCRNAGSYTVTGTNGLYSDQFGYNLIEVTPLVSNLVINPAALNVLYTANPAGSIYGNALSPASGNVAISGLVGSDTQASAIAGTVTWSTSATAASGVGNYAISGSGLTSINGNYVINAVQAAGNATAYRIDPRAITVAANSLSRVYGTANPALTYTIGGAGLLAGDTLTGSLATPADSTTGIGSYAITQGTLGNANYAITFDPGTLTITPAALTVAGATGSRIYTGGIQSNGFTVTGLVNGDTVTGVTGIATGKDVGTYTDAITGLTGTGLGNYIVTFVNGEMSVTPAPLRITGDLGRVVYNAAAQTNGFTISGLLGSDTVTGVSGQASGRDVGFYLDTLSNAVGTGLDNYTITYFNGALSITPAALTVTYVANPRLLTYGNAPSELGGTIRSTGLLGSDTISDAIGGTAQWFTSVNAQSGVGSYGINGGGLLSANRNYSVTFVQALSNSTALIVIPRAIQVTATALSRTYGAANPALTYSVGGSGLVNGDTLSGSLSTIATTTSGVGSYAITQGTLGNSNYAITYTSANLAVTPAPLTITGATTSVNYTGLRQTNTYTVNGLLNGDTVNGVTGLATAIDPGTFADMLSAAFGTGLSNYAITYVNGGLTINALPSSSGLVQFLDFTEQSGNGPVDASGAVAADEAPCVAGDVAEELRVSGQAQVGGKTPGCRR